MGQNQNTDKDSIVSPEKVQASRQQGEGSAHNRHDLKDRVGAKFQDKQANNPASGAGAKSNPGKPT